MSVNPTTCSYELPPPTVVKDDLPAGPPSCDALYLQLKKSKGVIELCRALGAIVNATGSSNNSDEGRPNEKREFAGTTNAPKSKGSCMCVMSILLTGLQIASAIASVVIGAKYLHECPAERYIPIYLVVSGACWIVDGLLCCGRAFRGKWEEGEEDDEKKNLCKKGLKSLFGLFLFGWFIAGNVWVYKLTGNWVEEPVTAVNYCHPTAYYLAFWSITTSYICIILFLVFFVCLVIAFSVVGANKN